MKKILLVILFVAGVLSIGTVYATVTTYTGPVTIPNGNTLFWGDNGTSIGETDVTGSTSGSFLTVRGFSGIIFKNLGSGSFGTGTEISRVDPSGIIMADGKSFSWGDLGMSISKTDTTGTTSGNYLNERGFDGILFRTGGTSSYGSGNEITRIDSTGITMANGKSFSWGDLGISLSRTDATGTTSGNYLNERGFDGILFRTGGTGSYGTGNEVMRITTGGNVGIGTSTPSQKLDVTGNIHLGGKGNITSSNDICIGTC